MNRDLCPSGAFGDARDFVERWLYLRALVDCGGQKAIDYTRDWIDPATICSEGEHPLLTEISRLAYLTRILEQMRAAFDAFEVWAATYGPKATFRGVGARFRLHHFEVRRIHDAGNAWLEQELARRTWLDRHPASLAASTTDA